jgi:MSHA biogenesis protein MshP
MKPSSSILRREAGVGIVTAIFLLVVLAGLGVAMVGVYTAQQASSNVDLLGARAYQAARAGLEWGVFQRQRNLLVCQQQPASTTATFRMPAGSSLSDFSVIVSCQAQGAGDLMRHVIRSTACNVPDAAGDCPVVNDNPESVRRTLEAEL